MPENRYIIADPDAGTGWSHFFDEDGKTKERVCRFVYDLENADLLSLEILRERSYEPASEDELKQVKLNLEEVNREALEDPGYWGLLLSSDLPNFERPERPAHGCDGPDF